MKLTQKLTKIIRKGEKRELFEEKWILLYKEMYDIIKRKARNEKSDEMDWHS